jgi:hypothetical protein
MPGCVLRIGGTFEAGELLARCPLARVTRAEDGHVLAVVADDDVAFPVQVDQAMEYLTEHESGLREVSAPTIGFELDFGVWLDDGPVRTLRFTPALASLAGSLGINLAISLYKTSDVRVCAQADGRGLGGAELVGLGRPLLSTASDL